MSDDLCQYFAVMIFFCLFKLLTDIIFLFRSFIEQYFGGTFDVEWKCIESDDEPINKTTEDFLQLSCFISQDIKYMINGLKNVS